MEPRSPISQMNAFTLGVFCKGWQLSPPGLKRNDYALLISLVERL